MAEEAREEVEWLENLVAEIRSIHHDLITEFGGLFGERAPNVYSACARPFHTFGGEALFPTPLEQAAVIFHGITYGHAFVDGCKRTGIMAALYLLTALEYFHDDEIHDWQLEQLEGIAVRLADGTDIPIGELADLLGAIFEHNVR